MCHTYGPLGNWELLAGYGFALQAVWLDRSETVPRHHLEERLDVRLDCRKVYCVRGSLVRGCPDTFYGWMVRGRFAHVWASVSRDWGEKEEQRDRRVQHGGWGNGARSNLF